MKVEEMMVNPLINEEVTSVADTTVDLTVALEEVVKPDINIIRGRYVASAVKKSQYPELVLPEIAFIGRSNVGKSSLINSLTRVRNLARVSGQPGKTQTINFFELTARNYTTNVDSVFTLVDLPGYGYAKTSQQNRKVWAKFIEEYFLKSPNLKLVCQLIDLRHEPMKSDIEMFNWFQDHNIPVCIIGTKADKLSRGAIAKHLAQIKRGLKVKKLLSIAYSSKTNLNRQELIDFIMDKVVEG